MRAIIIDDKDARALLDRLALESFAKHLGGHGVGLQEQWHALPESVRGEIIDKVHRRFHFVVTSWLQEQGANVVR